MTIDVTGTYTVAAGQNLTFGLDTAAYTLATDYPSWDGANFLDFGNITVTATQDNITLSAFQDNGLFVYPRYTESISVEAGGSVNISATGLGTTAYGYYSNSDGAAFENDGSVSISASQVAIGVRVWTYDPYHQATPQFDNTGTFSVAADDATGFWTAYTGNFRNSGTLTVMGSSSAVAVELGQSQTAGTFVNSGTITATASAGSSVGIHVTGAADVLEITNTGTITAQTAISEYDTTSPNMTPLLHLTNGGVINGEIDLGVGPSADNPQVPHPGSVIINTGTISGAIHLSENGGDFYNGVGGRQTGGIYLGGYFDTVYLGDDGETVHGGSASALVLGGAGDDVADGGTGGDSTFSYAHAASGVTVSLALQGSGQNTIGAGTDTLSNFQNLTGSDYADHLTGDANNNVIDGGGGDDVLDGGGGTNTVSYASAASGVTVSLALQGQAQGTGAGTDVLTNFQNLTGSAFNDILEGDGNKNVLDGGSGTNTVSYSHATSGVTVSLALQGQTQDTIGAGIDTLSNFQNLTGSAFADHLTGDANDNVIDGGGGGDVLDGGGGTNTVSYASAARGVTVSLALQGQSQATGVGNDTLTNFQKLTGSAYNDTLEGDGNNNVLDGGSGTNTVTYAHASSGVTVSLALQGQAQNTAGAGTDTLSNFQNLSGSAYNDTLEGNSGDNVLDGGGGTNTVSYAHAASGVTVSLALQGQAQNTIGAGADTLSNFQNLTGSAYNDTLEGDGNNNVLDGGSGTNTVTYAHASSGVTVSLALQGQAQNTAGAGTDTLSNFQNLTGSAYNDTLEGDGNNNVLDGGGGINTASYAHASSGVTVSLALQGQAQNTIGAGADTLSNFQNLTGSTHNDILEGNSGDNVLDGAGGINTVSYAHAASGVTVSLALEGQAQNTIGAGTDTLANFQNLTGSAYNDTLEGDGNNNVLDGGSGTNTVTYAHAASGVTVSLALRGQAQNTVGAGTDTLSNFQNLTGSAYNDTLEGDGNNNVLDGGSGANTVSYAHASSGVTVSLALQGQAQNTVGAGTDTLSNFQNLTGSAYNDTLEGDGNNNVLDGGGGINTASYAHASSGVTVSLALQGQAQNTIGAGADTLSNFQNLTGSTHNDILEGNSGDNVLDGGGGINTVSYAHAASGVTVSLALQGQAQNTIGAGTDTLANFQNLTGSAYDDVLTGSTGTSTLTGGLGADTFRIASGAASTTITDFSHGQGDKIDLSALSQFASLAQVTAAATQTGADTIIDTGSGSLILNNVVATGLAASDFVFASPASDSMRINVAYDSSVTTAPNASSIEAAVQAAVQFFEQTFSLSTPINIDVGYGELNGQPLDSSALAESSAVYDTGLTYQQVRNALAAADVANPAAAFAAAGLPASDPTGGAEFVMADAEAKAMGLLTSATNTDGYIGLSNLNALNFDTTNRAVAGEYDAVGVIEHELSEVLGRVILESGAPFGPVADTPYDLFRYTASGAHTFQPGLAYFAYSSDQLLKAFNNASNGGDGGDWASSSQVDAFDAFGTPGVQANLEPVDLQVMETLGYQLASTAPSIAGVIPVTPVTVSQTGSLGAGQSLTFNGPAAVIFSPTSSQVGPTYTNAGAITADGSASSSDVVGVRYDPAAAASLAGGVASTFTNTATGSLAVTASVAGADAAGVYFGPTSVVNDGRIQATSFAGNAYGDVGANYTADATGAVSVQALETAIGVALSGVSTSAVDNAGSIQTSGKYAFGVTYVSALDNSGSITATAAGVGSQSVGVYVGGGQQAASLTNSGTITAQMAIEVGAEATAVVSHIVNTGLLNGSVALNNGSNTLDSHAGTISGTVYLGAGANTVTLGAENNTVTVAGGTNAIDGGGGSNTVSYAGAAVAVHVNLGLEGHAQSTGVSTDTLSNIQTLVGSAYGDTLEGGGAASTLTGGLGADTFVFRPGDGNVTITDFSPAQGDRIDLSHSDLFFNLSNVLADASQVGPDLVINTGSGSVTLQRTSEASLTGSDFILQSPGMGAGGRLTGTTATYNGVYRDYVVAPGGTAVTGGPNDGSDLYGAVQRVKFTDGYVAFSPTDTAGQVYRVYEATLDRAPDQEGLTNWVNQLNSGTSLQAVVDGFVNSTEFQQTYGALDNTGFVSLLYENVLHRAPDAAGLSNWVNALNGGESRSQVVTGFSESQEDIAALAAPVQQGLWVGDVHAAEVARLYDTVLGRLPDAAGLANWTHQMQGGMSLQAVADGFTGSAEFQTRYGALDNTGFVSLLYENVLHRPADTAGLNNWLNALNAGETRAQVVVGFSESAEHIANTAPHIDYGVWVA